MEMIYRCESCGGHVFRGDGYIHTTATGWAIHHRGCFDFAKCYCIAVPRHWSDLLTARHYYAEHKSTA